MLLWIDAFANNAADSLNFKHLLELSPTMRCWTQDQPYCAKLIRRALIATKSLDDDCLMPFKIASKLLHS